MCYTFVGLLSSSTYASYYFAQKSGNENINWSVLKNVDHFRNGLLFFISGCYFSVASSLPKLAAIPWGAAASTFTAIPLILLGGCMMAYSAKKTYDAYQQVQTPKGAQ